MSPTFGERTQPRFEESLWRLFYRYLWPFQYFRDVTRGSTLERQQNYRHNRAMRIHLPGFMLKWLLLTGAWFASGGLLEQLTELVVPAACCFVTGTWTLLMVVLLATAWMWLERFPELY
jgi:hypothetical protein